MIDRRVQIVDHQAVKALGGDVVVGGAFAFIKSSLFDRRAAAWVRCLLSDTEGGVVAPQVVSLLGRGSATLPGAELASLALESLSLAVVTSDKQLYREGHDDVHLLVLDPLAASSKVILSVQLSGSAFEKRPLQLDANGVAAVTLRNLPMGDYEVRLGHASADAPACSFTVAAYRLAPLVASFLERNLEGEDLQMVLRLESFGAPLSGAVALELLDRGQRLARWEATARDGRLNTKCRLRGAGPHSINLQLLADPGRTASLPIVGSRVAERSMTMFSQLGREVEGSLLPTEGARAVRGIHLVEGAIRTSPLRIERLDTRRVRLVASTQLRSLTAVVIDPTVPAAGPNAVDVKLAPHPAHHDGAYRDGEGCFQQQRFSDALATFEQARAGQQQPHPNYAYYLACCHAKLGELDQAVNALQTAVIDGWTDFAHLQNDDDLSALREHPRFVTLSTAGRRLVRLGDLAPSESVEIDVPTPVAMVALGAFLGDDPWEGWVATLAPEPAAPELELRERYQPGDLASITITAEQDAAVYAVVKDARLLSADTPTSRLAGQLKTWVEETSGKLRFGKQTAVLQQLAPLSPPPAAGAMPHPPFAFSPPGAARALGAPPPPPPPPMAPLPMAPGPVPPPAPGAAPAGPPGPAPAPAPAAAPAGPPGPALARPPAAPAPPPGGGSPYRKPAEPPPAITGPEPEVLFAGLVPLSEGKGRIDVSLPDGFADYLVETFAIRGLDWSNHEARFRAEKQPFASFDLPAFVHAQDLAVGRLHLGAVAGGMEVTVTRDGEPVQLRSNGNSIAAGQRLDGPRASLSFVAGPGEYRAEVRDAEGGSDSCSGNVGEPGTIRRLARSLRFLQPGERLRRADIDGVRALRVLPGLDRPFKALVSATADYSHACCEQTAAKILAALAMFVLADERNERERAEAIIIAGIKRQKRMWLSGRGFRMYPHSGPQPNQYWGTKAARYMQNIALAEPSLALRGPFALAAEMANDSCNAYRIAWPPTKASTCEDAFAVVRFGSDSGAAQRALSVVEQRLAAARSNGLPAPPDGRSGAVLARAEGAYAAATLFRSGASHFARGLAVANEVVKALGDGGRLYSTVDSVAAIALMTELQAAGVLPGVASAPKLEVDGTSLTLAEATDRGDISEIAAGDGVVAVEVARMVEERWDTFGADVGMRVALEKNGRPVSACNVGDPLSLNVSLTDGYKDGDLLWVCLPHALSRVVGGGQVKCFSIDFAGDSSVQIPVAATATTTDLDGGVHPQRFAVCLRNMFEEERSANPGWIDVAVRP